MCFKLQFGLISVYVLVSVNSVKSSNGAAEVQNTKLETIITQIVEEKVQDIAETYEAEKVDLTERLNYLEQKVQIIEEEQKRQSDIIYELRRTDKELQNIVLNDDQYEKTSLSDKDSVKATSRNETFLIEPVVSLPIDRSRTRRAVGQIAFSAYLTQTNEHANVGEAIKFDQVLLNDGNGYNPVTGAFTAPLTGTYLFSFFFDTTKLTFIRLVVNGVNQVDAVANSHTGVTGRPAQSMGGNSAIVHVRHGEAVLVESYEISDSKTASSDNFRLCTFSGVLLY